MGTAQVHYGDEADEAQRQFARHVTKEIDKRGAVDVLRHGVRDRGHLIRLAYFRPAHTLHWQLQIAVCHAALGHAPEALAKLEPVLEIQQRQLGATDDEVVELRREAARLQASAGDARGAAARVRAPLLDLGRSHPRRSERRSMLSRFTG